MLMNELQGLHIELTNLCTLKCEGCSRTQFIKKWPDRWKNHNLDLQYLAKFLDIDLKNKVVTLCGNNGDCIYHPEFHQFITWFKQQGAILRIITNGSYRTAQWWQFTADILDKDDTVIFSIDGMPENFTEYRINADWSSIKLGIETMVASKAVTVWKFIPFAFNEKDIVAAKTLSENLGMDRFYIETSSRFIEDDFYNFHNLQKYQPQNTQLIDMRLPKHTQWKLNQRDFAVDPFCADQRSHFISCDGFYSPCCFIADHRWYYKTQFGKQRDHYRITDQTLTQIFQRQNVVEFYQNINQNTICKFNCPSK